MRVEKQPAKPMVSPAYRILSQSGSSWPYAYRYAPEPARTSQKKPKAKEAKCHAFVFSYYNCLAFNRKNSLLSSPESLMINRPRSFTGFSVMAIGFNILTCTMDGISPEPQ
ncbi:hypothetical protein D3C85_1222550 [compost metagenome]